MTNKIEMNMEQLERVSGGVSIIINSHTGPNGEILFDGSVTNTGKAPMPFHNIDYDTVKGFAKEYLEYGEPGDSIIFNGQVMNKDSIRKYFGLWWNISCAVVTV